jgi:hypothetical protein
MSKTFFYFLLLFAVLCPELLLSQSEISLRDTTVPRGSIYTINVSGKIDPTNCTSVKIVFKYDARIIDIKSVNGGTAFALNCNPISTTFNLDRLDSAKLEISCNNIATDKNILCSINVEGLVGPDSIGYLKPVSIELDGQIQSSAVLNECNIIVPGYPIIQKYVERLGQNYPNPFAGKTSFPFVINRSTNIKFYIYSTAGQLIVSSENDENSFSAFYVSSNGLVKKSSINETFSLGNYILEFTPSLTFSQGSYFLLMVTDNTYNKNFIYIK